MQEIRYLDKLIDELVKGKSMEKIFGFNFRIIAYGIQTDHLPLQQNQVACINSNVNVNYLLCFKVCLKHQVIDSQLLMSLHS